MRPTITKTSSRGIALPLFAMTLCAAPQEVRLPSGNGRDSLQRVCSGCHGLPVVVQNRRTEREWRDVVSNMIAKGARGTATDFEAATRYLLEHYGRQEKTKAAVRANAKSTGHSEVFGLESWPSYGNDPGGMRHSPLAQITPRNVSRLTRAWTYHHGEIGRNCESTPLVVNGTMYFSTPSQRVIAIEPETGREIWQYDPEVKRLSASRGISYWPGDDETPARILLATTDARLIALEARTGSPVLSFGEDGEIDLRKGVADEFPRAGYSITSPPAIYRDLAILGPELQEGPSSGPSGDPRAFDVRTGKMVWRFHTLPRSGEPGHETWGTGGPENRGGPSLWGPITVDTARGLVFLPVGNPADSFYGADRKGANLYANSVVALEAATGKLRWHYQVVHHDLFDYDLSAPPALIDVVRGGKRIPAVAQITKQGLLFILDRLTGEPLFGVEERPVAQSDVPGEASWPTQPFPLKPPPLARNSISEKELSRLSPESERYCRELLAKYPNHGPFTPFTMSGSTNFPGTIGGANWGGVAFDPGLGYIFVATSSLGAVGKMGKSPPPRAGARPTMPYRNEAGYLRFVDQDRFPCNQPPWGEISGVNANTGDIVWRVPLGGYPELEARGIRNTGAPVLAGPISTAGGLVFIAGATDARLRAFDSRNGRELWAGKLDGPGNANPMTFMGRNGKQYVVVASGGSGKLRTVGPGAATGDSLIAFALD